MSDVGAERVEAFVDALSDVNGHADRVWPWGATEPGTHFLVLVGGVSVDIAWTISAGRDVRPFRMTGRAWSSALSSL